MRVLTVFQEDQPLLRALLAEGCSVTRIGTADVPAPESGGDPYFYLGDVFEQIKNPFVLTRIRRALAANRAPYVMWNRDAPWNCAIKTWRKLFFRPMRALDIHLAHSMQSADLLGEPIVYFPNAADTDNYNPGARSLKSLRDTSGYRFDVSFVGTLNPRFKQVRARVEFLAELGKRLEREGVIYRFFDTSLGSNLAVADQVGIIQGSRINLNVGAVCDDPVPSWGMPERCFGVAACGGFLLCDERKHATETFPANAWADFKDVDDCLSKIKYFLGRFDLARDKAEILHRDVMKRHTYAARAQQLLGVVSAWRRRESAQLVDVSAA